MEISRKFAQEHAEKWVAAWNRRDIKAVLDMYCDDVEFSSPKIRVVFPEKSDARVKGKEELERYWSTALQKYSELHFAPVSIAVDGNRCFFEYVGTYNGAKQSVVEKFEFAPDGRVAKSSAFYGA